MRKRAFLATFTALVAVTATFGVRLTADATETAPTRAAPQAAPATFTHPGVMISRAQLDFVKGKVNAGAQPWAGAATGISVFLEDKASYDRAITRFKARAAAYIYVAADGSQPKYPPAGSIDTRAELISFWQGRSTFTDGLAQETCRDFVHTGYGLSAISHVAETTRIQGQDLWPELAERMRHALGLHTRFENGTAVPSNICGGSVAKGLGPVTEVAYNALANRLGLAMSNTTTFTESRRPQGTNNLFVAWETLTHANNPA